MSKQQSLKDQGFIQPTTGNGYMPPSKTDDWATPQALFDQEYMCSFLDGAGQFFRRIRNRLYPADKPLPEQGDFQIDCVGSI